eukprot:scaffold820_cov376-Prasinococcus_capsulatus_cf.AAC.20
MTAPSPIGTSTYGVPVGLCTCVSYGTRPPFKPNLLREPRSDASLAVGVQGSKVHKARRAGYGSAYVEGDVIGCLIQLPKEKPPKEAPKEREKALFRGRLFYVEEIDKVHASIWTQHASVGVCGVA